VSARQLLDELGSICSAAAREVPEEVPSETLRKRLLDPGAAVADPAGRILACSGLHHLGTFASAARTIAGGLSFELEPGEIVLLNDPYSGGSRVLDFHLLSPVEVGDPAGPWIVATRTTAADLGGDCFGGFNPAAREVWAEGARVTPLRVYGADGAPLRDPLACVTLNSRTPRLLRAQLDAAARALRGCRALVQAAVAEAGLPAAQAGEPLHREVAYEAGAALGESSRAVEARIAGGGLVRLIARPTAERIELDLSASDPAGPGYLNARRGTTLSAALAGALAGAPAVFNEGLLAVVDVVTEPGSVVDAPWPVATGRSTFEVAAAVAGAVRQALGTGAAPEAPRDGVLGEDGRLAAELAARLRDDEAAA
jgi:N-methylhydantoinase B